jgi:hypothetical protein
MNHHPRRQDQYYSRPEFREVDDIYVFDGTSGLYKPHSESSEKQAENHATHVILETPIPVRVGRDWLALFVSVLTLLVLALYTSYTHVQADLATVTTAETLVGVHAARDSADTAKQVSDNATKSFHVSERPYVTVDNVEFDTALEPDQDIGFSVICDNSGRSPALKVSYVTTAFLDNKRIGEPVAHEGATVIASGHPTKNHFIMNFSSPDITHIKASDNAFKIQGEIKYTDIFGEWHPTTWCFLYDGKQKVFKFCQSGNDVK